MIPQFGFKVVRKISSVSFQPFCWKLRVTYPLHNNPEEIPFVLLHNVIKQGKHLIISITLDFFVKSVLFVSEAMTNFHCLKSPKTCLEMSVEHPLMQI